jgi:hypothetical protein
MAATINFDDQPRGRSEKVNDEAYDGHLPPKGNASLASAKGSPKSGLRIGGREPHAVCARFENELLIGDRDLATCQAAPPPDAHKKGVEVRTVALWSGVGVTAVALGIGVGFALKASSARKGADDLGQVWARMIVLLPRRRLALIFNNRSTIATAREGLVGRCGRGGCDDRGDVFCLAV